MGRRTSSADFLGHPVRNSAEGDKQWIARRVSRIEVDGVDFTPGGLQDVLGGFAESWDRARAAVAELRRFEAERPIKTRRVITLLASVRRAIATTLDRDDAEQALARSRSSPRLLTKAERAARAARAALRTKGAPDAPEPTRKRTDSEPRRDVA